MDPSMAQAKRNLKLCLDWILAPVMNRLEAIHVSVGAIESKVVQKSSYADLRDAEFTVFSQRGEDGIIQYLVSHIAVPARTFVEIGVDDYRESNTRFLLRKDNWRGLIVNAGSSHERFLAGSKLRWKHRIDSVSAFVTAENVNSLIAGAGFSGELGLLSIDLDGNDYWVFDSIDVVRPGIVVAEYNSIFGPDRSVTVPYDPAFVRTKAHWSALYFGASLPALCEVAARKGFQFVGSNSAGVNAFFVRRDLSAGLPDLTAKDGWVESAHRESRDRRGRMTYVDSHADRLRLIAGLPLLDLSDGATRTVAEVFGV